MVAARRVGEAVAATARCSSDGEARGGAATSSTTSEWKQALDVIHILEVDKGSLLDAMALSTLRTVFRLGLAKEVGVPERHFHFISLHAAC